MGDVKRVKLFRNGRSQAIRIPKEFQLPGSWAEIRQGDGVLIVEPVQCPSLLDTLERLKPIDEGLPEIEDQPPEKVDI